MLQRMFDQIDLPERRNDLPDRVILLLGMLSLSIAVFGTLMQHRVEPQSAAAPQTVQGIPLADV